LHLLRNRNRRRGILCEVRYGHLEQV
jgi:hypothetical protein